MSSFFVADGDLFLSTPWTRGPWSAEAQHAGPAAALLGRAIERLEPADALHVARFSMEILRPIPVGALRVEAREVRPGRRVQLAQATLLDETGEVARASAWRIRPADPPAVPNRNLEAPPFPKPNDAAEASVWDPGWGDSYFSAMEWRPAAGTFAEPGPAAIWMRMRIRLVEGEDVSPLGRVLAAADSGNGISGELPIGRFMFINTDLTVHLVRPPVGEWIGVDAISRIADRGIGLAEAVLWDAAGRIGRSAQTLVVAPR